MRPRNGFVAEKALPTDVSWEKQGREAPRLTNTSLKNNG